MTNGWPALMYNSMLSVTILPNVYSALTNFQNELVFKVLYSFIFALVPVTIYAMYKNETGKLVALLSVLFFIFSINAFFGELTSVNRQIVAEFFLALSILLWLEKKFPIREKRILLIIFGISIAVSHYSIAIIYVVFVAIVFVISHVRPRFDGVYNVPTVAAIFSGTFLWLAFSSGSIATSTLIVVVNTLRTTITGLSNFRQRTSSATAVTTLPQTLTTATWINLLISATVNALLIVGIFALVLFTSKVEISNKYKLLTIFMGLFFASATFFPMLAQTLNFTRIYAISLLFLSPCVVVGALSLLKITQDIINRNFASIKKRSGIFSNKRIRAGLLLVAVLRCLFPSQTGFVNFVTGGEIHSVTFDYYRLEASTNPQMEVDLYRIYFQPQDAFSAIWLSEYVNGSSNIYADSVSSVYVLASCRVIPFNLTQPITPTMKLQQGNLIFLDSLNVVKGIVPGPEENLFNTSQISGALSGNSLVFSDGNSQIWAVPR